MRLMYPRERADHTLWWVVFAKKSAPGWTIYGMLASSGQTLPVIWADKGVMGPVPRPLGGVRLGRIARNPEVEFNVSSSRLAGRKCLVRSASPSDAGD